MARYGFVGYRQEKGRRGIRSHVIILPLDARSNAAAEVLGRRKRVLTDLYQGG